MSDKYIVKENYHGDVKYILADEPKKVDLSKPTDVLDHSVKETEIPPVNHTDEHICLTKPRDIVDNDNELSEQRIDSILNNENETPKQKRRRHRGNILFVASVIALLLVIAIIVYIFSIGIEYLSVWNILEIIFYLVLGISWVAYTKNKR